MHIALDYDGTYTADPKAWAAFIALMTAHGHLVSIVTFRDERYDLNEDFETFARSGLPCFFTRGVAKRFWCENFLPFHVPPISVWVDDKPESVLHNSPLSPSQLAEWRRGGPNAPLLNSNKAK